MPSADKVPTKNPDEREPLIEIKQVFSPQQVSTEYGVVLITRYIGPRTRLVDETSVAEQLQCASLNFLARGENDVPKNGWRWPECLRCIAYVNPAFRFDVLHCKNNEPPSFRLA